jgi:hypothetical protein
MTKPHTNGSGPPRLDLPPKESWYVKLPDVFGRRFMVSCDTEEEFDWSKPQRRENRSTVHMRALPESHRRLRDLGAHPIYLVDHPIVEDPVSVDILGPLQEAGECGIETQLHPWVSPPFDEEVNRTNSFAGNLPATVERAKLSILTDAIEQVFGRRPIMYRAGRYGVGPNTAEILSDLGYRIDVSVRSRFDYSDEKGPDFSAHRPIPYRIGGGSMLEVPLSTTYLGTLRRLGPRFFPMTAKVPIVRGGLARIGLLNRVSLTPEGVPLNEALAAADRLLDEGVQVISISYHSPSVVPGYTPFVRTDEDLRDFYAWWEGMLGLLTRRGLTAVTVDDLVKAAEAATPLQA